MMRASILALLSAVALSCSDATAGSECHTVSLPLTGTADAPTVTDVGLEVQLDGIVVVATATDPQGDANVQGVEQAIGVFPDAQCAGAPIVLRDDLAYSGVEETFGTAVAAAGNASLYNAISAALTWPVQVEFSDVDGKQTAGRVLARVEH